MEVRAGGEQEKMEELVQILHIGPAGAIVERVDTKWSEYSEEFDDFRIVH